MAILNASLNFNTLNVSAQVGDIIYYTVSTGVTTGGFTQLPLSSTVRLGPILEITTLPNRTTDVLVEYDSAISLPTTKDFISFAKNNKVNMSSLLGYYASVNFVNNSTEKVELFSVGSEVSESSK